MGGIICANFCKSRGGFRACRNVWHADCYTCLGISQFPMAKKIDAEGNLWHNQSKQEKPLKTGVRGAHVAIPFQCEVCWIMNLEGRLPINGLDDPYIMLI